VIKGGGGLFIESEKRIIIEGEKVRGKARPILYRKRGKRGKRKIPGRSEKKVLPRERNEPLLSTEGGGTYEIYRTGYLRETTFWPMQEKSSGEKQGYSCLRGVELQFSERGYQGGKNLRKNLFSKVGRFLKKNVKILGLPCS